MNKKLNSTQILSKAAQRYFQLKLAKHHSPDQIPAEIKSDQVKAVVEVLVEEINKILNEKQ